MPQPGKFFEKRDLAELNNFVQTLAENYSEKRNTEMR